VEAIEASSRIYSSTSLKVEPGETTPVLNIVEAITYAPIDGNIHLDCVYFILRMHPDIISSQMHSTMSHSLAIIKSKRTKYKHIY
jgi:hypothetical protein